MVLALTIIAILLFLGIAIMAFRGKTRKELAPVPHGPNATQIIKVKDANAGGLPQFGLLAATMSLFLIATLFYDFQTLHLTLFWVLWIIGLLVSIVIWKAAVGFAAALLSLVMFLVMLFTGTVVTFGGPSEQRSEAQTTAVNIGGEEARQAAAAGTGTKPETCQSQYKQNWDPNEQYRFASHGLWDNSQTKEVTVKGAGERLRTLAGHDARYLAASAWTVGMWDDPNEVAPLLTQDKTCLSTEGIALYKKLVDKWDTATAKITQAPAAGVNTGSNNGTTVVNADAGISGDRTALELTYPDGKKSVILIRCANHVLPPGEHKVPPGKTDNPPKGGDDTPTPSSPPVSSPPPSSPPPSSPPPSSPPPSSPPPSSPPPSSPPPSSPPPSSPPPSSPPPSSPPPSSPPPTTEPPKECPPGSEKPECNPKDPDDNVPGPTGKPTAPAPTDPPETEAPVEPTPADPTDEPGDPEPEVPAPGATEEPTKDPVPHPDPTVAPDPTDPGEGDVDPDMKPASAESESPTHATLGLLALPFLLGGLWRRRRV